MTEPAGCEVFYGDAIHVLRWRRRLSVRKLAREAGVSASSILNYEHGRIVPRPKLRRRIARALGVSPAELARLAGNLWRSLAGCDPGSERLAAAVAADLANGFHRATLPLVARLVAGQAAPRGRGAGEGCQVPRQRVCSES